MTPRTMVKALRDCGRLLVVNKQPPVARFGTRFAHHLLKSNGLLTSSHQLSNSIGLLPRTAQESIPKEAKGPERVQVERHVARMLVDVPLTENLAERRAMAGFAAGAAAAVGLSNTYLASEEGLQWDLIKVVALAKDPADFQHWMAQVTLVYMQGWLWAVGELSLEEIEQMAKSQAVGSLVF